MSGLEGPGAVEVGGGGVTGVGEVASDVNTSKCSWERSLQAPLFTLGHLDLFIGTVRFAALRDTVCMWYLYCTENKNENRKEL